MALLEPGPLLVILVVVLLLFGASAIPKLARSLGQAKGEFSRAQREFESEAARAEAAASRPAAPATPATPGMPDEAQVRKTARDLGIAEQGMPLDQVKREIQHRLN